MISILLLDIDIDILEHDIAGTTDYANAWGESRNTNT